MNFLPQNQTEDLFLYDENLKTALKKTKIIEKRVEDRMQTMKGKLAEFKNVCRLIRFQQLLKNPQQSHMATIISKDLMKQNSKNMDHESSKEDDESAKEQNISILNSEAKLEKIEQVKIEPDTQELKNQSQSLDQSSFQEAQDISSIINQTTLDLRKDYESEKIDSSVNHRSDYSTPKFPESEKESSFCLKSPLRGQEQSFIAENQDFQKTKQTCMSQNVLKIQNIFQPQIFLDQKLFSFTNLLQNQDTYAYACHIPNQNVSLQTRPYQILKQQVENQKENTQSHNIFHINPQQQQNGSLSSDITKKENTDNIMLKSVDKSVVQSLGAKSQSFHQIYDQFQNFFKDNSPLHSPLKQHPIEPMIEKNEALNKEPPQLYLPSLTINTKFQLIAASSQKVAKSKNRLFKEKRKKNSSQKSSSD